MSCAGCVKKLDATAMLEKKVQNETEESEGLFPTIKKDEKGALFFNSVNSIIPSKKFTFKEKAI